MTDFNTTPSNSAIDPDSFSAFVDSLMGDTVVVAGPAPKDLPLPTAEHHAYQARKDSYGKPAVNPRAMAAKVATNKREREAMWQEANPAEYAFLVGAASWSSFAADMLQRTPTVSGLSDNQMAAVRRMMAKCAAKAEAKVERMAATSAVVVDLAPVRTMFEAAVANGHKRPTYRAEGLVINRAPDTGANPGALYVKSEAGVYLGKVMGTTFKPVFGAEATLSTLTAIAVNPLEAAVRYGRKTGKCACCGRELSNAESIRLGIGPICRDKWGL